MADKTWPNVEELGFHPEAHDEGVQHEVEFSIAMNGAITSQALPGMRWVSTLKFPAVSMSQLVYRRRLIAFLTSLRGGADRLLLWNLLTPAPLGTLRGSPTVQSTLAVGATSATLANCAPGATLLRGDAIGLGVAGQRVMVMADAVADGAGLMPLQFRGECRVAVPAGTAAVWNRPTTRYLAKVPDLMFPQTSQGLPGFAIELVEDATA